MPEWSIGLDSKSSVPFGVPRVRIPISPPQLKAPKSQDFGASFLCSQNFIKHHIPKAARSLSFNFTPRCTAFCASARAPAWSPICTFAFANSK